MSDKKREEECKHAKHDRTIIRPQLLSQKAWSVQKRNLNFPRSDVSYGRDGHTKTNPRLLLP